MEVRVTDASRFYRWANHSEVTPPITDEEFLRWEALGWIKPAVGWEMTPRGRWQSLSPNNGTERDLTTPPSAPGSSQETP